MIIEREYGLNRTTSTLRPFVMLAFGTIALFPALSAPAHDEQAVNELRSRVEEANATLEVHNVSGVPQVTVDLAGSEYVSEALDEILPAMSAFSKVCLKMQDAVVQDRDIERVSKLGSRLVSLNLLVTARAAEQTPLPVHCQRAPRT